MDCHQVTSRALHDGDDSFNDVENAAEITPEFRHGQTGVDLEKRATVISSASYEETYPEGGFQAWSVVAGSWFALFASLGLMNTLGTFQAYVLDNQLKGYSEGTVGWVFSIYTFLAFFCGVYIGPVFDKYGPKWLVIAGSAFTVSGMIFMSFCTRKSTLHIPTRMSSPRVLIIYRTVALHHCLWTPLRLWFLAPLYPLDCCSRPLLQSAPRPGHRYRINRRRPGRHHLPPNAELVD